MGGTIASLLRRLVQELDPHCFHGETERERLLRFEQRSDYETVIARVIDCVGNIRRQQQQQTNHGTAAPTIAISTNSVHALIVGALVLSTAIISLFSVWRGQVRVMMPRLFGSSFLVSIMINFGRNYYETVAEHYVKLRAAESDCFSADKDVPVGTALITSLRRLATNLIATLFFITTTTDSSETECDKWTKALFVDPLWEVTPLNALAVTMSQFVLTPVYIFADHANRVFLVLFRNVPLVFVPILILLVVYIMTLFVLTWRGYRVSIPWLLDVEPTTTTNSIHQQKQSKLNMAPTRRRRVGIRLPTSVVRRRQRV